MRVRRELVAAALARLVGQQVGRASEGSLRADLLQRRQVATPEREVLAVGGPGRLGRVADVGHLLLAESPGTHHPQVRGAAGGLVDERDAVTLWSPLGVGVGPARGQLTQTRAV